MHADALLAAKKPGQQGTHWLEPRAAAVPCPHTKHSSERGPEKLPPGHGSHPDSSLRPSAADRVPAGHAWQDPRFPTLSLYAPRSHGTQPSTGPA